jgi:2-alkenal reductase
VLPSVVTIVNEIAPSATLPSGGIAGGAGFIVDARGYVVTNEHVVREPGNLTVILNDGSTRPATVVSHDAPFTDLAVLRIPAGGLRALPLADSRRLVPGQTVLVIGSPDFDYRNSVSAGVISGLQRAKLLDGVYREDLIQTDAPVNSGDSGGPLLNLDGEVVGLISFRDIGGDPDDPIFGISFALSSNSIAPLVRAIVDRGQYPRPYFGIDHLDLDDAVAQQVGLRVNRGALVRRVIDGSPAQKAGLRAGDVILSLGRNELGAKLTFLTALRQLAPNERTTAMVLRDGRVIEVTLELTPR